MIMYRQGDVLLVRISGTPTGTEVPMDKLGPVLALGEVTGHHHTVVAYPEKYNPKEDLPAHYSEDLGATLQDYAASMLAQIRVEHMDFTQPSCKLYESEDGSRMLDVVRPTLLRHDEHGAVFLDKGLYKVVKQKEFTPSAGWVAVQD